MHLWGAGAEGNLQRWPLTRSTFHIHAARWVCQCKGGLFKSRNDIFLELLQLMLWPAYFESWLSVQVYGCSVGSAQCGSMAAV